MIAPAPLSSAPIGQYVRRPDAALHAVHAFIDLSNIWYGVLEAAPSHDEQGLPVRLSAENLGRVLRAGRDHYRQLAVANTDVPVPVIAHFGKVGEVILRESGRRTGTEQANDETLQVRMYETIFNNPAGVVVLATGDGAGWRQGRGFIPALDAARRLKWGVEVLAWGVSANRALREWTARVDVSFVDLNDYYFSVSFVEGGRRVQPVSLRHRPTSEPIVRGRAVR
jgi:hypothetical protein